MCRPRREFRAESFALEGRLLLAILPQINVPPTVGFEGTTIPGTTKLSQVVMQQDGEATVSLSGYIQPGTGTLQVVVATDPSSPAVGVNVGAVDQTVTFANGSSQATVTVPILAGAPNPGEVDVNLTITPIDPPPDLSISGPLELRILASDATIPPKIVSVQGEPQGIVLTFSKPMDPVGASNVNNYAVRATKTSMKDNPFLGLIRQTYRAPPLWQVNQHLVLHLHIHRAAPGGRIRSRDELRNARPQAKAYLLSRHHRDPGAPDKGFGPARASVEPWPRSHRPGGQPDQRRHDSRKVRYFRRPRNSEFIR